MLTKEILAEFTVEFDANSQSTKIHFATALIVGAWIVLIGAFDAIPQDHRAFYLLALIPLTVSDALLAFMLFFSQNAKQRIFRFSRDSLEVTDFRGSKMVRELRNCKLFYGCSLWDIDFLIVPPGKWYFLQLPNRICLAIKRKEYPESDKHFIDFLISLGVIWNASEGKSGPFSPDGT